MSWIDKILPSISNATKDAKKTGVPEGVWKKCPRCEAVLYEKSLSQNFDVCPKWIKTGVIKATSKYSPTITSPQRAIRKERLRITGLKRSEFSALSTELRRMG